MDYEEIGLKELIDSLYGPYAEIPTVDERTAYKYGKAIPNIPHQVHVHAFGNAFTGKEFGKEYGSPRGNWLTSIEFDNQGYPMIAQKAYSGDLSPIQLDLNQTTKEYEDRINRIDALKYLYRDTL